MGLSKYFQQNQKENDITTKNHHYGFINLHNKLLHNDKNMLITSFVKWYNVSMY